MVLNTRMRHECQLCRAKPDEIIDGRTKFGSWAWMCPNCHSVHGVGLGTGKGQKFQQQMIDGELKLVKVAG